MEHGPVFVVVTPIFAALLLTMLSKFIESELFKDIVALGGLLVPLILILLMYPDTIGPGKVYEMGGWARPYGIVLVLDGLSGTMALITGMVTVLVFLYSLEAKRLLPRGDRYNFLFLFMTAGLYGLFMAGDIVNRYVFFELTIISTYVLLTYKGTKESLRACFNFLIIGSVASFFFLAAIALLYFNTGHIDFKELSILVPGLDEGTRYIIFSFLLIAVGMKIGLMPFHTWLPDAHVSAPTPMTAILAGLTVKTGVYILVKTYSLGFHSPMVQYTVLILAIITALAGAIMSFRYFDLKKILAWLTISQMGIITASVTLWTSEGLAGGIFHMINHSIFKVLLLLGCGAMAYIYGTRDIREISLRQNAFIAATLSVGVLGFMGIPPMGGFYSATMILQASASYPVVYLAVFTAHVLSVSSLTRVFLMSKGDASSAVLPESMMAPMIILAGLSIFIGATFTLWMNNVVDPAVSASLPGHLAGTYMEISYIFNIHGLVMVAGAVIGVLICKRLVRLAEGISWDRLDGTLCDVPVTEAVRYMIVVLVVVLLVINLV